jgi:hypothetical protein
MYSRRSHHASTHTLKSLEMYQAKLFLGIGSVGESSLLLRFTVQRLWWRNAAAAQRGRLLGTRLGYSH